MASDDDPKILMCTQYPRSPPTAEEIKATLANLSRPLTRKQYEIVEKTLLNSLDDPLGDGDQSPVPDPTTPDFIELMERDIEKASKRNLAASMHLRLAARSGLDRAKPFNARVEPRYIPFHKLCEVGAHQAVYDTIAMTQAAVIRGYTGEMKELLEKRVSLLRWTALHYCCYGATVYNHATLPANIKIPNDVLHFKETVIQLYRAGARIDAKDIAGHTPLSIAAGETATKESLELVPLLVNMGANVNIKNRFGDPLMVEPTATKNQAALTALLAAGGDGYTEDNVGMPVYAKALRTATMGRIWVNHVRENALKNEKCGSCGKGGASKFCSKCRKVYYCSRECQVKAWKSEHKQKCGKEENKDDYLDIVVETMTFRKDEPDVKKIVEELKIDPDKAFRPLQPKELGVPFRVFIFLHEDPHGHRECHLVTVAAKGGSFWLKRIGPACPISERFIDLVQTKADPALGRTLFFLAKFVEPVEVIENGRKKMSNVLRIDTSRILPPLKPVANPDDDDIELE